MVRACLVFMSSPILRSALLYAELKPSTVASGRLQGRTARRLGGMPVSTVELSLYTETMHRACVSSSIGSWSLHCSTVSRQMARSHIKANSIAHMYADSQRQMPSKVRVNTAQPGRAGGGGPWCGSCAASCSPLPAAGCKAKLSLLANTHHLHLLWSNLHGKQGIMIIQRCRRHQANDSWMPVY